MTHLTNGSLRGDSTNGRRAGLTRAGVRGYAGPLILALTLLYFGSACAAENPATSISVAQRSSAASSPEANTMQIRLTINGQSTTATLIDNPATRDFIALLPMTLTLEDYASTEKIAYLPKKLSTQGAPPGVDPEVGDIAYYAPWGSLAIFYRGFGYSAGLIKLGHLGAGIEALNIRGSLKVTIEAIGK